jgi:DNA-binding response OmpR family regulator
MAAAKVLAVDDESDILLIVRTALESAGMDVRTASNGRDALTTADEFAPDLIVLDVMMPEMDGFEVVRHLRENEKTQDIPVVMLTGVSDSQRVKQALDSGVARYIVKPFDIEELLRTVRQVLDSDKDGILMI